MIKLVDSLSYSNSLRAYSPMWKSGFAAALLLLSYLAHPVVQLILTAWMIVWTIGYARIPFKYYFLVTGTACLFFAASVPAIVIEIRPLHETVGSASELVSFSFLKWTAFITMPGLMLAAKLFIRILASLSCMTFLMFSTSFSELLQVMRKLRVPALVPEIMLIMYRFLFILFEIVHDMFVAQQARGGQRGMKNRLKDTALLIVRMFIKTMQRYKSLSNGFLSRGFADDILMAPYEARTIPNRYKLEICIGVGLLLLLEIWLRWRNMR
ncbi:cobalt ECF transporter T component CbiQ [Paenibacillus sedimenti]|uniref:Cobalt ECF transporter T component CbiQ n=1 Tax=Paenibacillus sedimenti TaxID=2770274 RepID=A0A926KPR5_9BACL|nr:cobalt ECF transporter T component CbiQ [Paenibacillus sedimenti]MBD0381645.1 cobalt ECF transporter T component CbiQ [Paenibacillus sedimenti]